MSSPYDRCYRATQPIDPRSLAAHAEAQPTKQENRERSTARTDLKVPFDEGPELSLSATQERRRHYCRGCGGLLSPEFRGHFHKECLRVDKRSRLHEQRRREQQRFTAWLQQQQCSRCGARYGKVGADPAGGVPCEASQPTQDRD